MKSREIIRILEANGWKEVRQTGSHKQFQHSTIPGTVTVPPSQGSPAHWNLEKYRETKWADPEIRQPTLFAFHAAVKRYEQMSNVYFPAIIERDDEGYGVFFPDLPGCVSAGETLQATAINAEEALSGHLLAMTDQGEAIPMPSDLDTIPRDLEVNEVCRLLVRGDMPGRKVRINIMMDEDLLAGIERVSGNRSQFLNEAARASLAARRTA